MRPAVLLSYGVVMVLLAAPLSHSTFGHTHHHAHCFSPDEEDTFIQTIFTQSMRRQSPEVFSIRNFLFCGTSAEDRKELVDNLNDFISILMTRLSHSDLSMLRFVSSDRPLILKQSRENLAKNLITINKDLLCMAQAGDDGANSLVRTHREDCVIMRHFRKLTEAARASIGPLSTCEVEDLEVDCSGWQAGEMAVWLMSYFVANQTVHFVEFLDRACVADYDMAL